MKSFYFGGCAWGSIYYIGVYKKIWEDTQGKMNIDEILWGGSSSGALIACCAVLQKSPEVLIAMYEKLAKYAREYGVFGKMSIYHEFVLDDFYPDGGDEYKLVNGKLFIGVTKFLCNFELVSEWTSNRELKDCVHASMHIPFFTTHTTPLKTGIAIDGAFLQNCCQLSDDCTTVGCISNSDINPNNRVKYLECYAPPTTSRVTEIFQLGYDDYQTFSKDQTALKQKIRTRKRTPPVSKVALCSVMWLLRYIESFGFMNTVILIYVLRKYKKIWLFFIKKMATYVIKLAYDPNLLMLGLSDILKE